MDALKGKVVSWEGGRYVGHTVEVEGILIPSGKGTWTSSDEDVVRSGNWVTGKLNGDGEEVVKSAGIRYVGHFKDNIRNGFGSLFFTSGGEHCGTFLDGKATGFGLRVFEDGSWYTGNWENAQLVDGPVPIFPGPTGKASATREISPLPSDVVKDRQMIQGTFTGQVNAKGEPHGRGVLLYSDGTRFCGQWQGGKRSGHGVWTTASGAKYDGEWKSDEWHGEGVETEISGGVYTGTYKSGQRSGRGEYRRKDGGGYDGEWKHGLMHGSGRLTEPSGDAYSGQMKDGLRCGKGEWISSRDQYTGEWQNDTMHGKGRKTELNGDVYEGMFKFGYRHGKGDLILANGGEYSGQWQDGKVHGKGMEKHGDGTIYSGQFVDGLRDGKGEMRMANGDLYDGKFEKGLMAGKGKYMWRSGGEYTGEFQRGRRHGQGMLVWASGDKYIGQFDEGRIHGEGVLSLKRSGCTHYGNFVDNVAQGHGIRVLGDGAWFEGTWYSNRFVGDIDFREDACPKPNVENARFQQERTEKLANEHAARLRRNALWEVTMPAASEQKSEKNKAFTAYTVIFKCRVTNNVYESQIRYSVLLENYDALKGEFPTLIADITFPPKKLFGNSDPAFIEQRRQALEKFVQAVVVHPIITSSQTFRKAFSIETNHETSHEYVDAVSAVLAKQAAVDAEIDAETQRVLDETNHKRLQDLQTIDSEIDAISSAERERQVSEKDWVEDHHVRMGRAELIDPAIRKFEQPNSSDTVEVVMGEAHRVIDASPTAPPQPSPEPVPEEPLTTVPSIPPTVPSIPPTPPAESTTTSKPLPVPKPLPSPMAEPAIPPPVAPQNLEAGQPGKTKGIMNPVPPTMSQTRLSSEDYPTPPPPAPLPEPTLSHPEPPVPPPVPPPTVPQEEGVEEIPVTETKRTSQILRPADTPYQFEEYDEEVPTAEVKNPFGEEVKAQAPFGEEKMDKKEESANPFGDEDGNPFV